MIQNHPGYADIEIDRTNLAQLSENSDTFNEIAFHENATIDEDIDIANLELEEEEREVGTIPNLLAAQSEL